LVEDYDKTYDMLTHCTGALCGSHRLNELFLAYVEKTTWKMEEVAESLGLTSTAFLKRASNAFEVEKLKYSMWEKDKRIWVHVQGNRGATESLHDVEISGYVKLQSND
jgi:hypothetical protein